MENIQAKLGITSSNSIAVSNANPKAIRVDLGCGLRKRDDFPFIGIDKRASPGVDIVRDIEKGLPFCDSSIDFVFASHFVEHITDLASLMEEIWRVLKRKGILELIYPCWNTDHAYFDPTHERSIHPTLWNWWNPKFHNPEQYGYKAKFNMVASDSREKDLLTTLEALKIESNTQIGTGATNLVAVPLANPKCIKIDLGCGAKKRNDFPCFIGIDQYPYPNVDIVRDVEKYGMPFCDCSVDFIYASHFMEHVGNLIFIMEEIWRVLKRHGILELITPKWDTVYAYAHPDHKRLIHPGLWGWWRPENEEKESYGAKASFELLRNYEEGEGLFVTLMVIK